MAIDFQHLMSIIAFEMLKYFLRVQNCIKTRFIYSFIIDNDHLQELLFLCKFL